MAEKRFLSAYDVAGYMDCSVSTAYKLIHRLNSELSEAGFIITPGRIDRDYFESKIYFKKSDKKKGI